MFCGFFFWLVLGFLGWVGVFCIFFQVICEFSFKILVSHQLYHNHNDDILYIFQGKKNIHCKKLNGTNSYKHSIVGEKQIRKQV